jgi:mono/diheme cytochrome c family protein
MTRAPALLCLVLGGLAAASEAAAGEDLAARGRRLAEMHCARCHVIDADHPHGGISSTPSFPLIVTALPDWRERFATFPARRPHPAFMRFEGETRPPDFPASVAEVILTQEDIDAIVAFAEAIAAQDNGEH